ncbi:S53 family peptidase [Solicola sp. PLA-1-18]|uniref:S53 family peptidase n=1 Tax=Solicola sp. PLA-1-18 TaxID=3380532 RepID=UPI003B7CF131
MTRRLIPLLGAAALATGALLPVAAHAAGPDRVTVAAAPDLPAGAVEVASTRAATDQQLIVTLDARDPAALAAAAKAVSDPSSASYRTFISPTTFTRRYAATDAQVAKVRSWLEGQGLTVGATPANHAYLPVSGDTAAVGKAFATSTHTYRAGGRTFTAPTSALTVPASMGDLVGGVVGLDRSRVLTTSNVRVDPPAASRAARTSAATDGNGCSAYYEQYVDSRAGKGKAPLDKPLSTVMCGYTPAQVGAARGIPATKATGKGRSIGITLWCNDPRIEADTNTWAKAVGSPTLKSGQYRLIQPAGGYDPLYCDDRDSGGVNGEQALDVQSIHGAAPDAKIVYSSASRPFDDALLTSINTLVTENQVDAITNSWGGEETTDAAVNDAYSQVFQQAALQGISVLFSSGDNGDNTGGDQTTTPPSADYPAANPWVTAVGGTSLGTGNTSGSKVTFETAWNTSRAIKRNDVWGAWTYRYGGGGGRSGYHAQPFYQKGVVPARFAGTIPKRAYPDLAGAADPYTGYLIGYHDADAASGNFTLGKIGGTSWSSPWTAGTLALATQKSGKRVGFLNPVIYGKGHAGLTDVAGNQLTRGFLQQVTVVGTDGVPFTAPGTVAVNAQSVQDQTLTSEKGYDNLTGFGVPTSTKAFIRGLR